MGRQIHFRFDEEKATEVLLYVSRRVKIKDIYTVLKVIYHADKEHLYKYGRFIFGDWYCAMENGPVPSGAYNIIKKARMLEYDKSLEKYSFALSGVNIHTTREANDKALSKSDVACLERAISEFGGKSFSENKEASHDIAYRNTPKNAPITVEAIAAMCEDSAELIEHLRDRYSI